ncbi:hypothetical protein G8E10_09420 [Rhizobiaceae bacterium CRRU44]|uniref:Uncharacterized protein n=1 Tax=Ferranicluibacter rubi TaxID=2715133 RepID=A0AA43ZDS2_9HYPH|nr:hypothetical protein [Ferranicluibacter rubi]NHT75898.1 hypothetical protein [Ferranicluibacter rubi]NHT75958.1 hypothetical protein [Ferranicluibacter rubi]
MADVKHTPGPWKVVSSVSFESGLTYVSVQPEHSDAERDKPLAMANGEFHVCRMSHTAARHRITLYEANARLIAAAPELLTELEVREGDLVMLRRAIAEGDPKEELLIRVGDMLKETRAVIEKAKGGAA